MRSHVAIIEGKTSALQEKYSGLPGPAKAKKRTDYQDQQKRKTEIRIEPRMKEKIYPNNRRNPKNTDLRKFV